MDAESAKGAMMPEEIRRTYHQQLDEMRDEIVRLGALVGEAIPRGTTVLLDGNLHDADELIRSDDILDALRLDIEDLCCHLLALQQPMAGDLRAIVTALQMASELERSGDLMTNVAKATRRLTGVELSPRIRGLISRMADQAQLLFRHTMDAYVDQDAALAAAIDDMDDRMDELHGALLQAIIEASADGVMDLQAAVQLSLVGRYYERIGDHAVNIGERIQYMVTGWMPEHAGAARVHAAQQGNGTGGDRSGSPA